MSNVTLSNVSHPFILLTKSSWLFKFLPEFVIEFLKATLEDAAYYLDVANMVIVVGVALYCISGLVCYILFYLKDMQEAEYYQMIEEEYGFLPEVPLSSLERVLIVTAHPDDECMFFGPTIMELKKKCMVYLLCLTDGNYYGLGSRRKEELWESCRTLGLMESHITLLRNTEMPDTPRTTWDHQRTGEIIMDHIERLGIHEVYTFDYGGVSYHPNHVGIYLAFARLSLSGQLPAYLKVYFLETVNFVRKFSVFMDGGLSALFNRTMYMVTWEEVNTIRDAMKKHKSQMKWYRWIYIYTTRYVYMNTYRELEYEDVLLLAQLYGEID